MSLADGLGEAKRDKAKRDVLGKIADLLDRSGIDVDDVGAVQKVNVWQGFHKNAEGEAEVVDLAGISLSPKWADGPEWPVVAPAAPVVAKPLPAPKAKSESATWVILPDPQIGFRRYESGELDPFHDEAAMACALQLVRMLRPEGIVNLGDTLDLAEWSSKFAVHPEFVLTTQPTLDAGHRWLADQRANSTDATRIVLMEGNHDDRLGKLIMQNAKAALRLRQACTPPDSWPVLSVQNLLRLDDLGVRYVDGYPAGRFQIAAGTREQPPLVAIHGEKLDVAKVAKAERQSFVQGHIHRIAEHNETYEVDGQPVTVTAFSPGCLCRTDGAVPSTKGGTNAHGQPLTRWESWQNGAAVVTVHPDGSWAKELVRIERGRCTFRGKVIEAA